ncbi:MAG: S8/S53 family peptidase [Patulibacter minatonensis]
MAVYEAEGSWFLYRPGRVLVDRDTLEGKRTQSGEFRERVSKLGADRATEGQEAAAAVGLVALDMPADRDLIGDVRDLRTIATGPVAAPEHVLLAAPHRIVNTAPPIPADPPTDVPGARAAGKGLRIAVLDTGLAEGSRLAAVAPADVEVTDDDHDGVLDPAAGHGTFVTGLLRRYLPDAELLIRRVFTGPAGLATELEIAAAFAELPEVDLVNCSFAGTTLDDLPPVAIQRAIAALPRTTVVVAAAGNDADERPHWPAAFKRVVGVGAIEGGRGHEGWQRAPYSSFGHWVDAAASGSGVHSSFVAFDEHPPTPAHHFGGGARWSGTSFATPKVTAAIALLAERDGISVREAVFQLIEADTRPQVAPVGTLVLPRALPPSP